MKQKSEENAMKKIARRFEAAKVAVLEARGVTESVRFDPKLKVVWGPEQPTVVDSSKGLTLNFTSNRTHRRRGCSTCTWTSSRTRRSRRRREGSPGVGSDWEDTESGAVLLCI